jgi:hypothetical protein
MHLNVDLSHQSTDSNLEGREEIPLTIQNICLTNVNPPLFPTVSVVNSDQERHVFVVVEIEESGEAPHAIENSRMVYVRTGDAANPYDLAEVDLIIDLVRRRSEPFELRTRLLSQATDRARQVVLHDRAEFQMSLCPTYPRNSLSDSETTSGFASQNQNRFREILPANSLRRVPNGVASLVQRNAPDVTAKYFELNRYGLLFAARDFYIRRWGGDFPQATQLHFGDLLHTLMNLFTCASRFYAQQGYLGNLIFSALLSGVQGHSMEFRVRNIMNDNGPDDFKCYSNTVSVERQIGSNRDRNHQIDAITDIIAELTWAFWQGNGDYPRAALEQGLQPQFHAGLP